jgi:hypothetical protein
MVSGVMENGEGLSKKNKKKEIGQKNRPKKHI